MKILCYVAPWCDEQFEVIAKNIDSKADIYKASAFRSCDKAGLVVAYYEKLKAYPSEKQCTLESLDIDMIQRCRTLRALSQSEAKKHLDCARKSIAVILDTIKPDLILSETVDSFMIDSLRVESELRGIKFLGLVPSFVNGYFRVTSRGELKALRIPAPQEVDQVLEMIEKNSYRPAFIERSKNKPYFSVFSRWFKNLFKPLYFIFKRFTTGEMYNNHFWGGQIVSSQWLHPWPHFRLGDPEWEKKIEDKPTIYIPLQHIPEATVDYWCEDLNVIDYENVLLNVIRQLKEEFNVVVKEHPNVLGLRNPKLYKKLTSIEGVIICPTQVDSNYLVEKSDAVLVWTGTVGFEAALRGKPVLCLANSYYISGSQFLVIGNTFSNEDIRQFIVRQSGQLQKDDKREMISNMLRGLIKGRFVNNGTWSASSDVDIKNASEIGKSLSCIVSSL